jgi:hypothetical protein
MAIKIEIVFVVNSYSTYLQRQDLTLNLPSSITESHVNLGKLRHRHDSDKNGTVKVDCQNVTVLRQAVRMRASRLETQSGPAS